MFSMSEQSVQIKFACTKFKCANGVHAHYVRITVRFCLIGILLMKPVATNVYDISIPLKYRLPKTG
jgi:hypothetical protein